jgi:hypothetical protein
MRCEVLAWILGIQEFVVSRKREQKPKKIGEAWEIGWVATKYTVGIEYPELNSVAWAC